MLIDDSISEYTSNELVKPHASSEPEHVATEVDLKSNVEVAIDCEHDDAKMDSSTVHQEAS